VNLEFSNLWFKNRSALLKIIDRMVRESDELSAQVMRFESDDVLFRQGDDLNYLYILLDGTVRLIRERPSEDVHLTIDDLYPGSLIGIIAFTTGNPAMSTARALEAGRAVKVNQEQFEQYINDNPRLQRPLQQLLLANIVDRYQYIIKLQEKLESLNEELKSERNELKEAYEELERTQGLLIHQEKMATLGQLVAGIAHEINNPVSTLLRSTDHVVSLLDEVFGSEGGVGKLDGFEGEMFRRGLQAELKGTEEVRSRMKELQSDWPGISRQLLRKLSQMPDEVLKMLDQEVSKDQEKLKQALQYYECGRMLRTVQLASGRIEDLVKSLKSYSRQDRDQEEPVDIRGGIRDTVQILNNRIKYHDLEMNLQEIPKVRGKSGELNQVWSNLLMNACDAMEDKKEEGNLRISCGTEERNGESCVWVAIEDSGPGIPASMRDKIFEPNFTTKRQQSNFGLGLGLTISKEIVSKHGGEIEIDESEWGGAKFVVTLPAVTEGE